MSFRFLQRRMECFLLCGALLLGTIGCGSSKDSEEQENTEIILTGEMIPVAAYREIKLDLSNLDYFEWQNDKLIYLEKEWSAEQGKMLTTLYRAAADGTGIPEELYTGNSEEYFIWSFALGRDDSLYFLERAATEDGSPLFCLRKLDNNLQEVYLTVLDHSDFSGNTLLDCSIFVDESGSLLLLDYYGNIYFFDPAGQYMGSELSTQLSWGRLIDAGKQGCFLIKQDGRAFNPVATYLFQKVDFTTGTLSDVDSRDFSAVTKGNYENISVLSGYELGILISTESGLYSYDYDTRETVELLSWQNGNLNVNGSSIHQIRLLQDDFPPENLMGYTQSLPETEESAITPEDTPELSPVLEALSYDSTGLGGGENAEIVQIGYLDRGYVPEKLTITLGLPMITTVRLGKLVRSFNRSNRKYEIAVKNYNDIDAFTEDLLYHQSEIPDILDLSWIDKEMLENKGLLTDLKPYFKKSDVVGQSDILELIWNSCDHAGKITSMITAFSITSISSSADTVPTDGWTYDQFFTLAGDNPDSKLLNRYTATSVWNLLSYTMDSYIDWNKGQCHFDSPEFIQLLNNINELIFPENQEDQKVYDMDEEIRKLLKKEFLLSYKYYYSPYDYATTQTKCKNKAWNVGFPTQNGELFYLLNPTMQFSIYDNSDKKDGAWAFLEFLLSEEEQSWYGSEFGGFPVRKSAFEDYLMKPYSRTYRFQGDNPSEETAEAIRNMTEHLYMRKFLNSGELYSIILEETQAYFAGDKSAEECVKIIQNRAQLYLDENF